MENFEDIKAAWHAQNSGNLPSPDAIEKVAYRHKQRRLRIAIMYVVSLVACLAVMIWLTLKMPYTLWTTPVGEILILAAAMAAIGIELSVLLRRRKELLLDCKAFVYQLKYERDLKGGLAFHQRRITFSLLALAYGFFIYEMVAGSLRSMIIGYGILMAVALGIWFMLRPYALKRERKRLQASIEKFENLSRQLHE